MDSPRSGGCACRNDLHVAHHASDVGLALQIATAPITSSARTSPVSLASTCSSRRLVGHKYEASLFIANHAARAREKARRVELAERVEPRPALHYLLDACHV